MCRSVEIFFSPELLFPLYKAELLTTSLIGEKYLEVQTPKVLYC